MARKSKPAKATKKEKVVKPTTFEQDVSEARSIAWRRKYFDLHRKYERALKSASAVEALVADIRQLAPLSYKPAPKVNIGLGKKTKDNRPQSAVLVFSDTHIGKVVRPDQTLGFGKYDFGTFLARLKYMEETILSILRDHTTTPVPELVVAMLGDMLDGALLHGAEVGQVNTLFSQFYGAGHAIAQFFRNLAAGLPKIRIETAVGNHTRWQNQRKMPTTNRFSNLDMFLYAYVQALTHDVKNIEWNLTAQPFCLFDVQGWKFHGSHGDHIRGGDRALGIPNHSIGRSLSVNSQLFGKAATPAPNFYLLGHLHRSITIPHALGDVMVNGGFPGLDNYALAENFNPVDPSQRFFLVHPKYGRTATYELSLKFAQVAAEAPYAIPATFDLE